MLMLADLGNSSLPSRAASARGSSGGTVIRFAVFALSMVCFGQVPRELWSPVATFSILGYDPATGEIGGAVQSRVFSVGNGVLWAEAGVGAAATQAIVDVSYGPHALNLLKLGYAPDKIVKMIHESDPD